ncbi:hypothetical protein HEK616_01010 [Streptomyces nigrescens]|uniref:Uncharacterized protein n=1 Tax=Streptomyces nigrescens TaxID=1920 RepID=A0ABM7ZKT1_STRNI|nr:hypothetical protein HEK616_01010 [Streptomyces nigrescens]
MTGRAGGMRRRVSERRTRVSVRRARAGGMRRRAGVIKSRGSRAVADAECVLPSADVLFARVGRPAGVRAGTEGSP